MLYRSSAAFYEYLITVVITLCTTAAPPPPPPPPPAPPPPLKTFLFYPLGDDFDDNFDGDSKLIPGATFAFSFSI